MLSHRRAQRSMLTVEESDRAVRLARVKAVEDLLASIVWGATV